MITPDSDSSTTARADGPARALVPSSTDGSARAAGPDIRNWAQDLASLADAGDDALRIDQIRLLENIKSACAAAQARITATFVASQRAINSPGTSTAGTAVDPIGQPRSARDPAGPGRDPDPDSDDLRRRAGGSRGQQAATLRAKAERLARRSAAAQVALARRESPQRGGRFVGLADVLTGEMPHTLAALSSGVINEWRAMIIVRDTACLTADQRRQVDAEIAGKVDGLGDARIHALVTAIAYRLDPEAATERSVRAASDRRLGVRPAPDAMAYLSGLMPITSAVACYASLCRHVDAQPAAPGDVRTRDQRIVDEYIARLTGVAGGRVGSGSADGGPTGGVTGRMDYGDDLPAAFDESGDPTGTGPEHTRSASTDQEHTDPDPVAAVRAAFQRAESSAASSDGARSAGGHPTSPPPPSGRARHAQPPPPLGDWAPPAEAGGPEVRRPDRSDGPAWGIPPGTDVMLNVVITDRALLAGGDDPAILPGNHPIPAPLMRRMLENLPPQARVWIRRLYTRPDTGELVAQDSRRREFPPALRRMLLTRDQTCRTPWCNAMSRHADHLLPAASGGATSLINGQGLSEDCNYIRTAPGWAAGRDPARPGDIVVTTPTGHRYRSPCPDLIPGHTDSSRPPIDLCDRVERRLEWQLNQIA